MTSRVIPAARVVFSPEDRQEVLAMIDESLRTGSLTLGPSTRGLEEEFGRRHGSLGAVAVSSGTAALEIILRHLGVEGREVVVPTNTFFASAAAVLHAGGRLRLADIDADTLALSVATLREAVTPQTAAVVVVHIGGLITPEIDRIRAFCDDHGIVLVEDAAHAHGSSIDDRPAGSFGRAAAFSFYPTKVITSGEGGMILSSDRALCEEAVVYRDQGKAGFFGGEHIRLGYAWRMSELHTATGLVHVRRLDQFIATRQRAADVLNEELADIDGVTAQVIPARCRTNYYKYVAFLDPGIDRDVVKSRFRDEHGVSLSGEVYAQPLHRQSVFAELATGAYPVADDVCARQICLPVHSDMSLDEASYVASSLRTVLVDAATPISRTSSR